MLTNCWHTIMASTIHTMDTTEKSTYMHVSTDIFPDNSTEEAQRIHESIVPPILEFLCGSIGNIIAMIILIRSAKRHKRKPFYRLVLALTDLSRNILVYPMVLTRYASHFTYNFSDSTCQYVSFMFSFAFLGSALLVTAMSFDRFHAILFPFYYKRSRRIIRTHVLIGASLATSASICVLPVAGVGEVKLFYPGSWCFINFASHESIDRIDTYLYAILGVIIFIIALVLNSAVIAAICHRIYLHRKDLGGQRRLRKDIYVVSFLLAIVIVFIACWLPIMTT